MLLSACDPKPGQYISTASMAAKAPEASAGQSGASPSGIKPADSGDKVDEASAHKGPSEGGAAVGGMSGRTAAAPSGGAAPAPSGGDGTAPK
jgi:hypothetical protein